MKKIIALILASLLLVFLVSCGSDKSGGESPFDTEKPAGTEAPADTSGADTSADTSAAPSNGDPSGLEGKYVCVVLDMDGIVLNGEDVEDIFIELKGDGSAVFENDGIKNDMEWEEKGGKIVFSAGGVTLTEADVDGDVISFEDWSGFGISYTFAKEGSAAADPSLYVTLSEDEKAMVGSWSSYAVVDVLGDDLSEEYYEDALKIDINDDLTYTVYIQDEELESGTWGALGTFGMPDDSENGISWELEEGELHVDVTFDDEYVVYICKK